MKPSKFTFAIFALLLLSLSALASDNMKANIHIYDAVHIGATDLAPGDYEMTWAQSGPNTDVTFSQGKRVIVTVPARVAQVRSGYPGPAIHTNSVSHALTGVDLSKVSISFESESAGSPTSSNDAAPPSSSN